MSALVLFAGLMGILGLLVSGYRYGIEDQVEQLPIVMRILDPGWLSADEFVNAQSGFGPRYYYFQLLAALARFIPLWVVCLALQSLCTIALAIASALAARSWFNSSLAGLLASSAAVMVMPFYLGNEGAAWTNILTPTSPAVMLAVIGISLAVKGRAELSAVAFGFSAVFHPLVGLEAGALSLTAILIGQIVANARSGNFALRSEVISFLQSALILFLFSLLWIVPALRASEFRQSLPDRVFIDTLAWYRAPHHYLPSQWPRADFLWAGVFFVAAMLAWADWFRRQDRANSAPWIAAAILIGVLAGYVVGHVFTERIPVRIVVVAQLYRLSFVVGWMGIILLAGSAAHQIESGRKRQGSAAALGLLTAASALISQINLLLSSRISSIERSRAAQVLFVTGTVAGLWIGPHNWVRALAVVVGFWGAWWWYRTRISSRAFLPPVAAIVCLTALFSFANPLPQFLEDTRPVLRLEDTKAQYDGLDDIAKANTESDAQFLTPADWGGFRLTAERAILVDWKAFSFQDRVMADWRERLEDVHGKPENRTWKFGEMNERYRELTDARLQFIAKKYGVQYAVLYRETPTRLPILVQGQKFKLADLRGGN